MDCNHVNWEVWDTPSLAPNHNPQPWKRFVPKNFNRGSVFRYTIEKELPPPACPLFVTVIMKG